jgi:hypothetical protein
MLSYLLAALRIASHRSLLTSLVSVIAHARQDPTHSLSILTMLIYIGLWECHILDDLHDGLMKLSCMYNFTVMHKTGKENVNGNALSQLSQVNSILCLSQDNDWIQWVKTVQGNDVMNHS